MKTSKEFRKTGKVGFLRQSTVLAAFVGGLALVAGTAHANLITDGNYEGGTTATTSDFTANGNFTSFVGWKVGANTGPAGTNTVSNAATHLDGNDSAKYVDGPSTNTGEDLYQTFTSPSSAFDLTLSAVAEEGSLGSRSVPILLGSSGVDPALANSNVINFRVVPNATSSTTMEGDVQLYLGTVVTFTTVLPNAFNYTSVGNFDNGTLSSQSVNTIEIAGTMSSGSLSYVVTVNGVSSATETLGQTTPINFLNALAITNVNSTETTDGPFIVDDVVLDGATPEPASMCLMVLGAAGLMMRRRTA